MKKKGRAYSRDLMLKEGVKTEQLDGPSYGTSVFDPVLCEIIYRWFCPPKGSILDPFSGGSVRGIVAAVLSHPYIGIDLSGDQITENRRQWDEIKKTKKFIENPDPQWICADSATLEAHVKTEADLIFSCPPYADLERYSDDPKDLSTMAYPDFLKTYRAIIKKAMARLKPNRFACFVVGDVRDAKGYYVNFVGDTVAAFLDCPDVKLYNEAVLITATGSLPLRVANQFKGPRKLGKTHQNVLIFCKGDWRKFSDEAGKLGDVDIGTMVDFS
jgi:DNA modification methylase